MEILLGSALWGWTIDRAICFELLDQFYQRGYREIDGATNYPINKRPEDFRKSEKILSEWISAHGVTDLRIIMKIGSINNLKTPEHNLTESFILINLEDYRQMLGNNLHTLMIHWDNRDDRDAVAETFRALAEAREQDLKVGLSGIRHPELYADLNAGYAFDFRIQIKHNLLKSDYSRYAPFHGAKRFITYGLNAAGLKFDPADYRPRGSLQSRGGNPSNRPPLLSHLQNKIVAMQLSNEIRTFNQCGMLFAYHSPDVYGLLTAPSTPVQMRSTLDFYEKLSRQDYANLYEAMLELI